MPSYSGPGHSPYTLEKQMIFSKFLGFHLTSSRGIIGRNHWAARDYHYYDLNGGPGVYDNGDIGSPLIFISKMLNVFLCKNLPYVQAHIFESKPKTFQSLYQASQRFPASIAHHVTFHQADHEDAFLFAPKDFNTIGLMYSDENGATIPLPLLSRFALSYERLDILVHCTATAIKRTRRVHGDGKLSLRDIIQQCPKKTWHIRRPYGPWQWTFLYGTNWAKAPLLRRQQFYNMASPEGIDLFQRLDRTVEERADNEGFDHESRA